MYSNRPVEPPLNVWQWWNKSTFPNTQKRFGNSQASSKLDVVLPAVLLAFVRAPTKAVRVNVVQVYLLFTVCQKGDSVVTANRKQSGFWKIAAFNIFSNLLNGGQVVITLTATVVSVNNQPVQELDSGAFFHQYHDYFLNVLVQSAFGLFDR